MRGRPREGEGYHRHGPGYMTRVVPLLFIALPPDPQAPRKARTALAALDGLLGGAFGDVQLLVSELVTNGVRHAGLRPGERLRVSVALVEDRVRVEVADPGPGFEHGPLAPDPTRPGGWGLRLVEELAQRWGVERDGETIVWFEVARAG